MENFRRDLGIAESEDRAMGELIQEKRAESPRNFYQDPSIVRGTKTNHQSWYSGIPKRQPVIQKQEEPAKEPESSESQELVQARCDKCGSQMPPEDPEDTAEVQTGGSCPSCQAKADVPDLQMTVEKEAGPSSPEPETNPNSGTWIVEDGEEPAEGQMTKAAFLKYFRKGVTASVNSALSGFPVNAGSFGMIDGAITAWSAMTPVQIEQDILKYVPQAARATTATSMMVIMGARFRFLIANWRATGDFSVFPPEVASRIPGSMRTMLNMYRTMHRVKRTVGDIGNSIMEGARSVWGNIRSALFMPEEGGAHQTRPEPEVLSRLGDGQTMDGNTRGRMENAVGGNLGNVRIHTGAEADALTSEMNAQAFTIGNDVVMGSGKYQPGTTMGDALLAHEMAHVRQQEGASGPDAALGGREPLEQEANQSAARAVAGDALQKKPANQRRSGLRLMKCDSVPENFSTSEVDPSYRQLPVLSESDAVAVDKLTELSQDPEVMEAYRAYTDLESHVGSRRSAFQMCAQGMAQSGAAEDPTAMDMSMMTESIRESARERLMAQLARHGIEGDYYTGFGGLKREFTSTFQLYSLRTAYSMLEMSRTVIKDSQATYLDVPETGSAFDNLYAALEPLRELRRKNEELHAQFLQAMHDMTHDENGRARAVSSYAAVGPAESLERAQSANRQEGMTIAAGMASRFPMLASKELTFDRLAADNRSTVRSELGSVVTDHLEHIRKTEYNLNDNPEQVWKLQPVIDQAKMGMGISNGSMHEDFIKWKQEDVKRVDDIVNLALGALALALGALSGGGGTVATLALVGSAGVGIAGFVYNYDDYQLKHSAHRTDFDSARALSAEDPSFFWLAMDLVFAAVDLAAAARMFRAAKVAARAAETAGQTGDDLAEVLARNGEFSNPANYREGASVGETVGTIGRSFDATIASRSQIDVIAGRLDDALPSRLKALLEVDDELRAAAHANPDLITSSNLRAWEEISLVAPVNMETYELLLQNSALREMLAEFPEAARWLRKCASPCFPPNLTAKQIRTIDWMVKEADAGRLSLQGINVNEFLYQYRDKMDDGIKALREAGTINLQTFSSADLVSQFPVLAGKEAQLDALLAKGYSSAQIRDILQHTSVSGGNVEEMLTLLGKSMDNAGVSISHVLYGLSDAGSHADMVAMLRAVDSSGNWTMLNELVQLRVISGPLQNLTGITGLEATLRSLFVSGTIEAKQFKTLMADLSAIAGRESVISANPVLAGELTRILRLTDAEAMASASKQLNRWSEVYGATGPVKFNLPGGGPPVEFRPDGRITQGKNQRSGVMRQQDLAHIERGHGSTTPEANLADAAGSVVNRTNNPGQVGQWTTDRDMFLAAERSFAEFYPQSTPGVAQIFDIPEGAGRVFWATNTPPPGATLFRQGNPPVYIVNARRALVVFGSNPASPFTTMYPIL